MVWDISVFCSGFSTPFLTPSCLPLSLLQYYEAQSFYLLWEMCKYLLVWVGVALFYGDSTISSEVLLSLSVSMCIFPVKHVHTTVSELYSCVWPWGGYSECNSVVLPGLLLSYDIAVHIKPSKEECDFNYHYIHASISLSLFLPISPQLLSYFITFILLIFQLLGIIFTWDNLKDFHQNVSSFVNCSFICMDA